MAKYKSYDYSQSVLIPVCLDEQLMPGSLEFAIHTLVQTRIDTSILITDTTMMRRAARRMIQRSF